MRHSNCLACVVQMLSSLKKITSLPDDTNIFCGHEYTLVSNFLVFYYDTPFFELECHMPNYKFSFGRVTLSLLCPLNLRTRLSNLMQPRFPIYEARACQRYFLVAILLWMIIWYLKWLPQISFNLCEFWKYIATVK